MMSLPYCATSRLLPERKPSPRPTSSSKLPTPHAMPNMVRNERSLCAQRVRKICAKMSRTMRIRSTHSISRWDGFARGEPRWALENRAISSDAHELCTFLRCLRLLQIHNSSHSNALLKFPAPHRFRCYPHDSWLSLSLG